MSDEVPEDQKQGASIAADTQAVGPTDTTVGDSTVSAGGAPVIVIDRSVADPRTIAVVVQHDNEEQKSTVVVQS